MKLELGQGENYLLKIPLEKELLPIKFSVQRLFGAYSAYFSLKEYKNGPNQFNYDYELTKDMKSINLYSNLSNTVYENIYINIISHSYSQIEIHATGMADKIRQKQYQQKKFKVKLKQNLTLNLTKSQFMEPSAQTTRKILFMQVCILAILPAPSHTKQSATGEHPPPYEYQDCSLMA